MGSMNKVILIGRLGRDPEDRMTAGGTRVANFSLATNQFRPGNGNGAAQETTEWHRIVAFGKAADLCIQYLHKGNQVCIEGSMQTRSWEKPAGEKHYTTEVIASRVTFLDGKNKANAPQVDSAGEAEDF
ncbi:MAG: single-stranded DNA-binding protein [Acidobacteria bacterium]|jgi:single-strand DNA-binding protein|nr:single-stranded DNA-binding protein [Acidobacteriota bacterium]